MSDDHFFVLLKPNFSNPTYIRAVVQFKIKHKSVVDIMIDTEDSRNLIVAIMSNLHPDAFLELVIYFEDRRKC
jgi:hypothetical protein